MVHGPWFIVYGLWLTVDGLWFMVYGLWFMVYGLWFMVEFDDTSGPWLLFTDSTSSDLAGNRYRVTKYMY